MPIWEVELSVYGPIKIKREIRFQTEKGLQELDPFFSDINIRNINDGLKIFVTAFAPNSKLANNAALVFVGQMLDALVIELGGDIPIYLSLDGRRTNSLASDVKRIITENEIKRSFKEARILSINEPVFLKAYGWYRKGLYTEDPFDKFLAFYNTLERVTTKYYPRTQGSISGSKSQMWECFKAIWGEYTEWPLPIQGNQRWIDNNYETRKDIAHGLANVNVEEVEKITSLIDTIQLVAYIFLRDWKIKQLNLQFEMVN
jgi:hypothetical protein